jgi:hypothetical protein
MGLDLTYIAKKEQLSFRLSKVDVDITSLLSKSCPKEIDVLFGVSEFGEETSAGRLHLFRATEAVLQRMEKDALKLSCVYKYRFSDGPFAGLENCGMMGTVKLNQDGFNYIVDSGVGFCNLTKEGVGKNGMGYIIETIDIRSVSKLNTDNMGEMEVYREKKKTSLERQLKSLKQFLEKQPDETIIKILG